MRSEANITSECKRLGSNREFSGNFCQKMSRKIITFFILHVCFFNVICAGRSQTCKELKDEKNLQNIEIEKLEKKLLEYKLVENKIQDISDECNEFQTCSGCVQKSNDLNCGWCFLRNRCSFKENCPGSYADSNNWIPSEEHCPRIKEVTPHMIWYYNEPKEVKLTIPNLPMNHGSFICSFNILEKSYLSSANIVYDGVSCSLPQTNALPAIPEGSNNLEVTVSVRTPQGPTIASTSNITLYDCSRFESCMGCTNNSFPCSWCLVEHRCTFDTTENCADDTIISGIAISDIDTNDKSQFCTRISLGDRAKRPAEILVPSGTKERISVKITPVRLIQIRKRFTCEAEDHDPVKGDFIGDIIFCSDIEFSVQDREPVSSFRFNVYWGEESRRMMLDNPQDIHVVVFDCSLMATSCGTCLTLPEERYKCGWCEESNSCVVKEMCKKSHWMDRNERCTKPVITSIFPRAILPTRTINITIEGENLGREFDDIDGGVQLLNEDGDVLTECTPFEDQYVTASRIVCQLAVPDMSAEVKEEEGYIEVKVWNEFTTVSKESITFVDPTVTTVAPAKGVESGGTVLEIQGFHLDVGKEVKVFIEETPCVIISRDSYAIRCITSSDRKHTDETTNVVVTFDGSGRISAEKFSYVKDPRIDIVKTPVSNSGPRGTPSGGSMIIVEGSGFDHIQNPPYLYVIVDNKEYIGSCDVKSSTRMECLSPRVPAEKLNFCGEKEFLSLDYGLMMDGIGEEQNYTIESGKYRMYPDPYFMPFRDKNMIKILKADYLTIDVEFFADVFNHDYLTVEIGREHCILISTSRSQITCKAPRTQPKGKDDDPDKIPEVWVKVAGTMKFFIGYLQYD